MLRSHSLKSPSFPTTVIFFIISCFFDLTIAEVFSVNLLKKAGGWEALGGEREPTLQEGDEKHTQTTLLLPCDSIVQKALLDTHVKSHIEADTVVLHITPLLLAEHRLAI